MTNKLPELSVSSGTRKAPLSAGQKRFNNLLKKIEMHRQLIQTWQKTTFTCQKLWGTDFHPLVTQYRQHDWDLLVFLDNASDRIKFSKKDRYTLQEIICELAESLMELEHDEALMNIFTKHAGYDIETVRQQENDLFKTSLEETFGVDLGDEVNLDSMEDVTQRLHEKLEEAAQESKQNGKKKSARETRQEEEQKKGSQSVRDVYRKLVSALHPDRETDDAERDRKTVLMQRANQAYAESDLLSLLHLQIEIEQIDQTHIDSIPNERLKHYNRVLADQLLQLQDEIEDMKMSLRMQFLLDPFAPIDPKTAARTCQKTIRSLRTELAQKKKQLLALSDTRLLKGWLREHRELAAFGDWLDEEMSFSADGANDPELDDLPYDLFR